MTGGERGEACLLLLCNHIPPTAAAHAVRDSLLHLLTNREEMGEAEEKRMGGIMRVKENYKSDIQRKRRDIINH